MPDGQPTQPTPQPEAPPVEAPAAVPQPAPAPEPTVDPRLAHLVQHYLPEGVDLDTELMHVVQGIGPEGEATFHYRPIVVAPEAPAPATVDPTVPAVAPAPAEPPVAPAATPTVAPPTMTHPNSTVVAAAPGTTSNVDSMDDKQFDAYYNALLEADLGSRSNVLASGL